MSVYTELEVVNDLIGSIGERPVNALSDPRPLVAIARARLKEANAREQSKGWWFNTELVSLAPTTSGEVILPEGTLKVDPTDTTLNYLQRAGKLYNMAAGDADPYNIGASVDVTLVRLVPFADIPAPAQVAIAAAAKLFFLQGQDGDTDKISLAMKAYQDATVELRAEHTRAIDANLLRSPSFVRTYSSLYSGGVGRLLVR